MKPINRLQSLFVSVLSFLLVSTSVFAQSNSEIFIGTNGELCSLDKAIYIQKIKSKSPQAATVQTLKLKDADWEKIYTEQYKKTNDSTYQIKANSEEFTGTIYRTFTQLPNKIFKFKDVVKGIVLREGLAESVMPLLLHGKVTEYYKNGNKKSISEFNHNELVSNQNWLENGDKYIDNIFYSTEVEPTFTPGMRVLHQHIIKGFKEAGVDVSSISGSVLVGFVVMENGAIDGIRIIKGVGSSVNTIAFEQFKSLKGEWKPAKLNDKTVRYYQIFPINFIYKQYSFEFAELRGAILHFGAY
ncbi:MAG: energy transducer TonB [Prolixibacteraceae bacterium]|nr:energy transducer TonB [Prolixibacteraceae bacterium]